MELSMLLLLFCGFVTIKCTFCHEGNPIDYDVTCSSKHMKIALSVNTSNSQIYLERMKGYQGCQPKITESKAVFKLSLDNLYGCGITRMYNKLTGSKIYYHRVIIDRPLRGKDVVLVNCVLPADGSRYIPPRPKKTRRNVLPDNFFEPEFINITGSIVAHAPTPYLSLAIRQNGRVVDAGINVQPGTPLEMVIYLDEKSRSVYGLLASYLKVTDNTPNHEEVILMNGCSIDQYIFGNFETPDNGKSLFAKFRAFKFPDSNYVLFVGTVNVCLQRCKGVPCGNNQFGYGRKKRDVPSELPRDPNKVFEVELTTLMKIQYSEDHFKPKKGSLSGEFHDLPTHNKLPLVQEDGASQIILWTPLWLLSFVFWWIRFY